MKILTASQMRELDRQAIENLGIPGLVLMENAGREVAGLLLNELKIGPGWPVLILAGKGNNGGDGLVAARHLFNHGVDCEVLLLGREEEVKGDALVNLEIAKNTGIKSKLFLPLLSWTNTALLNKRRSLLMPFWHRLSSLSSG
jgi:NAD(P)H-hydrate epimerase